MGNLSKLTLPLVNPVHVAPLLEVCHAKSGEANLHPAIEGVRVRIGDNMRSDDTVRFIVDAGVLGSRKGILHVTPLGHACLAEVFRGGEFDARRWLRFLYNHAAPELPACYFVHHGIRFLSEAKRVESKDDFRDRFTRYLRERPEVFQYLVQDNIDLHEWEFSGASADRLVRCLKVWGAVEGERDLVPVVGPADLSERPARVELSVDEFWIHLAVAYQSLAVRHPSQTMFPIWRLREGVADLQPMPPEQFYDLLRATAFGTDYGHLVKLYRGADAAERQEFLEVASGNTTDHYYLIHLDA